MKVLIAQNHHVGPGGTEVLFKGTADLMRRKGVEVVTVERDNANLRGLWSKISAFGSAIYSFSAKKEFAKLLRDEKPDVAHFFNIYPQLSISVIDACNDAGVPVVLSVQDYKYTCPTAQHLRDGKVCEKCLGGREYNCAIHNCRGSMAMSVSYAVRNMTARWSGSLHDGAAAYVTPTKFVGDQLIKGGFDAEKVVVVPNPFDLGEAKPQARGEYAAYVGRISKEKGLPLLIEAARRTGIPTKIAGDLTPMPELRENLPPHVELMGRMSRESLPEFYARAKFLVVPSVWYEAFGIVAAEAMSYSKPVIASNMGGLPEVVSEGETGLLFESGNIDDLADKMKALWNDDAKCTAMGESGRRKAERLYHPYRFFSGLMNVYQKSIDTKVIASASPV